MIEKDPNILDSSDNAKALVTMACLYAASEKTADQNLLFGHLGSAEFLNRLNSEDEYWRYPARNLEVARIIKTLMKQDAAPARATLIGLSKNDLWRKVDPLIELLNRALVVDIPAGIETIEYWDKYSRPKSVYLPIVIEVIFINRSEPALTLFESKLNDPEHDDEYKELWLRREMLCKRNDLGVLQCCERMILEGSVDELWHQNIVEALFDYNPGWYRSLEPPRAPLRALASDDSKQLIGKIGKHALTRMDLFFPGLREKIRMAMKEIDYQWNA